MRHHFDTEDIHQEFDMSMWESKQKGFNRYQALSKAKFKVWDYKRAQLKQHFRKACECGKNHSFTVTACPKCHGTTFERVPIREYPETLYHDKKITSGDQKNPDPADIALASIEQQQFRAYIIPYCNGKYDMYMFDALMDGQKLSDLEKIFGCTSQNFDRRFAKLKQLYKSFTGGKYEDPPKRYSKETAVYNKTKGPTFLYRGVLGAPCDTFEALSAHLPSIVLTNTPGREMHGE